MVQKYVAYGQADDNVDHVNAWYKYSQSEKVPYVTIRNRRKYADVLWDYINLPSSIDSVIRSKDEKFVDGFIAIFKEYANQKSEYRAGSFVVEFINIDIDKAPSLAGAVYDYVFEELGLAT